jgi:sensor histidine kinase YesM
MPAFPALRMRTKILSMCISCTLLALCLQALFFQSSAASMLYERERESSRRSLQSMQDELYMWIKSYENGLIKVYNRAEFLRDLAKGKEIASGLAGAMPGEDLRSKYRRIAYDLALTIFDAAQGVNAVYVYDSDDKLVSSYRSASTPRFYYPDDIYKDKAAYNAGLVAAYARSDQRVMLVSSYYNESRQRDVLRFALKIYGNDIKTKIGYIVCDADSGGFLRIVEKYVFSGGQVVWLQPSGDRPAFRFGLPLGKEAAYYEAAVSKIAAGSWKESDAASGRDSVLFDIPQEKYDLTAFSLTPQYLLEESQRALARNLVVIALLVIAVAALSAALVALSLTRPLTRMSRSLKRIRDGETGLRLDGLKSDEIGELGTAVNEMLDRIQALIAEEYDAKLLLKQTEYKALQAQVNPHFLYNSLDTMSGLALSRGCEEVSALCRALANIFRYSIDMKEDLATIGSELLNVKNYMYVMNARAGNGASLDIRVDPLLLGEKVPRLSLQPLVENALLHGLKDKRGEKSVVVEGAARDGRIELSVADNGVGMDAREFDGYFAGGPVEALARDSAIGLRNIDARIKLLFGDGYGISVESEPGAGFRASFSVPKGEEGAKR